VNRRWNDERGGILVISAVVIPVFLLLTALVVDGGNWFTHKRQLQNRADAGALAAGVEYLSRLQNCATTPGTDGPAIADVAKNYAGTSDAAVPGTKYNQQIAQPTNLTVEINSTDGLNPCVEHDPDSISPAGGYWTDVKVRETNIGTLFGGFGLNLPSVTARARVEVKQITGIERLGLPFIAETGDTVECVWAKFVRGRDGRDDVGFSMTGGGPNPVELTRVGTSHTWEATTEGLTFDNAADDVAVQYWLGSTDGSAPCDFDNPNKVQLPDTHDLSLPNQEGTAAFRTAVADNDSVNGINWINVYDDGHAPGAAEAPKLRLFRLTAGSCGNPGFISSPTACTVGFTAIVDDGGSPAPSQITVNSSDPQISSVTVLTSAASTAGDLTTYTGTITVDPGAQYSPTERLQSYTQTGASYFSVSWRRTVGFVGSTNCASGAGCSGTFPGETVTGAGRNVANVQQAIYVADPVASTPLASTELVSSGTTPITGSYGGLGGTTGQFTIRLTHNAVLNTAFVSLLRESVQSTGNRTRAIFCGNSSGPGGGTPALQNGIEDGCAKRLVVNEREDSCDPSPTLGDNPWDCVQLEQGNKTAISKGLETRFTCTPNLWTSPSSLPPDGDQRWAYIVLTGFGRTVNAANNDWLPIEGLVRVYVTGWDTQSGASNCSYNDDPPRGYDGNGAQLWGHMVNIITLDDSVIVGEDECDLTRDIVTCKPQLVR
jgi:hypothetical protein